MSSRRRALTALLLLTFTACAGVDQRDDLLHDLGPIDDSFVETETDAVASFDGTLDGYVGFAVARHPALRAAAERWRANAMMVTPGGRWPNPQLTLGYSIRLLEPHAGVMQMIPWPSGPIAAANMQSEQARAAQSGFQIEVLQLRERISVVWWELWAIEQRRAVLGEQLELVRTLTEALRARLEVGRGSLADLAQLELRAARLEDGLAALTRQQEAAAANLRGELGVTAQTATPIAATDARVEQPSMDDDALITLALQHPAIARFDHLRAAARAQEDHAAAGRYPDFSVGVEWSASGSTAPTGHGDTQPTNDRPGVIVKVGIDVPIWQGATGDQMAAARAEQLDAAYMQRATILRAEAEIRGSLARLRDSARRVRLYERTLVPQAEAALGTMQGAFETGQMSVAGIILAYQDLLDIRLDWIEAMAEHQRLWTGLEATIGQPLPREDVP